MCIRDRLQALPIEKSDVHITGSSDYAATANSDIVIITAGLARKPGMSRDDLLNTNFKIMATVIEKVVAYSPESILIVVSNPLDAMVQAAYRLSGFNRERVLGMAGVLDAGRFRSFIAAELDVSVENVHSFTCLLYTSPALAGPRSAFRSYPVRSRPGAPAVPAPRRP